MQVGKERLRRQVDHNEKSRSLDSRVTTKCRSEFEKRRRKSEAVAAGGGKFAYALFELQNFSVRLEFKKKKGFKSYL